MKLAASANDFFDGEAKKIKPVTRVGRSKELNIACEQGCAYCCNIIVGTTFAQGLLVANSIAYATKEKLNLLRQVSQKVAGKGTTARKLMKQDCPFLQADKSCGVYEVRPLSCRSWVSFDKRSCKRSAARPAANIQVMFSSTFQEIRADLEAQLIQHQEALVGPGVNGCYELLGLVQAFLDVGLDPAALAKDHDRLAALEIRN